MKRSAIQRKTPLRSKPKHQPTVEREPKPMARPLSKPANYSGSVSAKPIGKENASQSPAYQKAAKALGYCMRCKAHGVPLDFCHRDQGKGTGIKTDVREGWPGCRPCHIFVGSTGALGKEARRAEELILGAATRAAILAAGTWPKNLPLWKEE